MTPPSGLPPLRQNSMNFAGVRKAEAVRARIFAVAAVAMGGSLSAVRVMGKNDEVAGRLGSTAAPPGCGAVNRRRRHGEFWFAIARPTGPGSKFPRWADTTADAGVKTDSPELLSSGHGLQAPERPYRRQFGTPRFH